MGALEARLPAERLPWLEQEAPLQMLTLEKYHFFPVKMKFLTVYIHIIYIYIHMIRV